MILGRGQNGSGKLALEVGLGNSVRKMKLHFYTLLTSECECLFIVAEILQKIH